MSPKYDGAGVDTLRWAMENLEGDHKETKADMEELKERVKNLEIEQAKMGIKLGIWAAIGASLPMIAGYIIQLLK